MLGSERVLAEQATELPQKDELCGAFWGLVSLRAAGQRTGPDHEQLDQDAVAAVAGSRLSPPPRIRSRPPDEPSREDYRLELPIDAADPGTSAAGVAQAIQALSANRLAVVPATGAWRVSNLLTLLESLSELPTPPVAVVANLHTGKLWPVAASEREYARYLETGRHNGPQSDWSIGHFVALVGLSHGGIGTLIHVADTYPSRGQHGRHRQPLERIVAALQGDDKTRGLLIVLDAHSEDQVIELVAESGLEARFWDSRDAAPSEPR